MNRALLAVAGRGAYTAATLGTLAGDPLLHEVDRLRAAHDLPPLRELDATDRLDPSVHLRPANAAPLTYLASLREATAIAAEHDVVAVAGNGFGWCTALAAAGVLSSIDGLRLVQEIGVAEELSPPEAAGGGQLLYPLADSEWRPMPDLASAVARALDAATGEAWLSVELGSYAVLAGTEAGLAKLAAHLPPTSLDGRSYPLRLTLHGPDHTPLAAHVASCVAPLARLGWGMPHTTLIDGRGARHTPWSTDPGELASYTLGPYLVSTYRFATSLRVALREYAPERVLLPGPGTTLVGIVGAALAAERYRGITDRSSFAAAQAGDRPPVVTRSA